MFASKNTFLTASTGPYIIGRSVRTRNSANGYFSRTPSVTGSQTTWTLSMWFKRGLLTYGGSAAVTALFGWNNSAVAGQSGIIGFSNSAISGPGDNIFMAQGATQYRCTAAVFRDPSAWYHLVVVWDSTNATDSLRARIYINGVLQTYSISNSIASGTTLYCNTTIPHNIAADPPTGGASRDFFDGYLTEINFVNGQALAPSSFGATDTITGVWNPIKYSGSYGTNGFYLNFSDNSAATAAAIGKDSSGNGNNWTPNNISVTAGVTYDSMIDSPTTGLTASNYAVWNPLYVIPSNNAGTFAEGNLSVAAPGSEGAVNTCAVTSMPLPTTGKWYWEVTPTVVATAAASRTQIGIMAQAQINYVMAATNADCFAYTAQAAFSKVTAGTYSTYGAAYAANDVIGVAVDLDNGAIYFAKNGVWQNSGVPTSGASKTGAAFTTLTGSSNYFPAAGYWGTFAINFGQRPLSYSAPSGYSLLNTQNLPTPTIVNGAAYMAATTYTGNGGTLAVTNTVNGVSFQPDFVWVKGRSYASYHGLYDAVRGTGTTKGLCSNLADTEGANGIYLNLTSFNSNGFTVGATSSTNFMNASAGTLVGWQWKAGESAVTNTNGTITSTIDVGATQGFSIVTYTGNGVVGATIGHGLGAAPSLIMLKARSAAVNWVVYLAPLGNTGSMYLNLTNAFTTVATWNNTTPTSTVFSVNGAGYYVNDSGSTYVAYCFTPITGYSAFGTYLGNGSADGTFVYTGFRPRWIMIRITNATTYSWLIFDTSRMQYNQQAYGLYADLSIAEQDLLALGYPFDILSNGFKARANWGYTNASGYTYFYAAFAENPFKYSRAR